MKKFIYMILLMGIMFIGANNVGAVDCNSYDKACVSCTYGPDYFNFTFNVYEDENNLLQIELMKKAGFSHLEHTLSAQNFLSSDGKSLKCPSKIYGKFDGGRNGQSADLSSTECNGCADKALSTEVKNDKTISQSGSTKACDYESMGVKITVTSDGTKIVSAVATNGYIVSNPEEVPVYGLDDKCPRIYVSCGSYKDDKYCHFSQDQIDIRDNSGGQRGSATPSVDDLNGPSVEIEKNPTSSYSSTSTKQCINCNGAEIPYALSVLSRNIINLVQLLVPVIIILTGMVELLRSVIAGDEKKMDEVKPKLFRKIIAGVIIFLIFAIVKFGFSFLGSRASASFECASYFISEDASGHTSECKTREDAINGTEGPSSSSPSGKLHCNDYTYSECPISDETGIKCRKNDVNKTCNPASLKLSCGDYSYNDCPDYDEKGNKCQSVVGDSTHKFCTEDGTYKRCTDYNYKQLGYCPQQDSYGNNCKTQSTGNSFICIGA